MSEFKISRLRFSWAGEWEDQKEYNKDEIVQYEGKAYVCLIPHTSNGFYNDLQDIEPKWEIMMTGQTWKGIWEPFTLYSLDNIIIFGGIVYKCNLQHTSASEFNVDIEKWDTYAESKTWASEWLSDTLYGVGDIVQYGGSVYECIVSHRSAATDLEGLEVDYTDVDDSTEIYWKLVQYGVQWRGDYALSSDDSAVLRYKLNDIVKYGPSLYRCIVGHAPELYYNDYSTNSLLEDTFDQTLWEEWMPGLDFDGVWAEEVIYQPGDVVIYGGYLFRSKVINNINLRPSTEYGDDSTDAWELISQAWDMEGAWDANTDYRIGNVVTYGGDLYVALLDNSGEVPGNREVTAVYASAGSSGTTLKVDDTSDIRVGMTVIGEGFARGQAVLKIVDDTTVLLNEIPDGTITDGVTLTFAGVNALYWELMIPGFNWEGRWAADVLYNQDDIAYWKNATYKCVREHTSALVNRPDNDLSNSYWVIYLQHYQGNALSDLGEMAIFTNEGVEALAIGAQSNVLKTVGDLPVWSEIDFTPQVYYVATNGTDVIDGGTTPDTAWKTIKYACERVKEGTLHPNAKELLLRNKEFIVLETFYWLKNQVDQQAFPFNQYVTNDDKTLRDIRYVFDGVVIDLIRGGNARTVENTLAYFDLESTHSFTNADVQEQAQGFALTLQVLFNNIEYVLTNTAPIALYQSLMGNSPPVEQYFNSGLTIASDTLTIVAALENIIITALNDGNLAKVPAANERGYATINIKSGTYEEHIPIVVPSNVALNGDELRGAAVKPAGTVNTLCTRTFGDINQFIVGSTVNMEHNTPVQFVSLNPVTDISTVIGDVVPGQTYYVIGDSITDTSFSVAAEPDGPSVDLFTEIGYMYVYGGEALHDMFRVQNGTGIRNMTLTGLLGTLTDINEYETRRPTGGSYVSLDPGEGVDDTTAWITRKSPYVQNVTNFGKGCVGMKIDSTLHNGGNTSMVCNDFTQIISDGIGVWCTGGNALVECVSVFSYYNYAGYMAEDGGRIRATNGNSSYGTYGVIAEGFDAAEVPATGTVNNRFDQARATAVSALGANAEILKVQYEHAGEQYFTQTTNLLTYSNQFLDSSWMRDDDTNINIIRASSAPFANEDAWKVSALTNLTDSSYLYKDISIAPQGGTYTNVQAETVSGSGVGATFDVTVLSDRYIVAVNNGGSGYVVGNDLKIPGSAFGGTESNDISITVDSLSITAILTVTYTGTVPAGSDLGYTCSIYAKKNTANYFDMYAIFSGYATRTSHIRYNFEQDLIQGYQDSDGGYEVTDADWDIDYLDDDWIRLTFTTHDITAQNTSLQFRLYPRGIDGITGATDFYGAQVQTGPKTFYLHSTDNTPTAYANLSVTGAGSGVKALTNELRSGSVFQTRLLEDAAGRIGGQGYKVQSNNAQGGNTEYLTIAQSDVGTAAEYENLRLVVSSGKGAGQYGIISRYAPGTKNAYVLKESFDSLEVVNADSLNNRFELDADSDFHTVYPGQKIQFTPTVTDVDIIQTSQNAVQVLGTFGDLNNIMYVTSTARLRVNQKINFTGTTFGGVTVGFDYYILNIIDERSIQISTTLGGGVWPLNNINIEDTDASPIVLTGEVAPFDLNYPANTSYLVTDSTAGMQIGYPIKFTGTSVGDIELGVDYYIHDIYDSETFSISSSRTEVTATDTNATGNLITVPDTSVLIPMNPIVFKDPIGGLLENTQYYVNDIDSGTDFTVADSVITTTATETEAVSNLITVTSTAGFIPNSPIVFTGTTFGGIVNNRVYYVQVVNDGTSFTVSEAPGGAALSLTTATGSIITRTPSNTVTLTTDTGTMTGTIAGDKETVTSGVGEMLGTFSTQVFGGVLTSNVYYVLEKFEGSGKEFTIESTLGSGVPVALQGDTGSMQIGEVGWDHINPGTPLVTSFDSTSVYTIEPRLKFTPPPFVQEITGTGLGSIYQCILSDGLGTTIMIPRYGTEAYSTNDGVTWNVFKTLPINAQSVDNGGNGGWIDGCYGAGTFMVLSEGGDLLRSVSGGDSWLITTLPTLGTGETYSSVTYGNGVFVVVARGSATTLYSTDRGYTWTSVNDGSIGDSDWVDIAYGKETFVAISGSSHATKYSTDGGATWTEGILDDSGDSTVNNWRKIRFGNGRFVAVSSDERSAAYSVDGITWYNSNLNVKGTLFDYGQGVFVLLNVEDGVCCKSEDGYNWKVLDGAVAPYSAIGFGYQPDTYKGYFYTTDTDGGTTRISTGALPKARASVDSTQITNITMLEPGSGYDDADSTTIPTLTIIDPNNSREADTQVRIGNGSLGAPTFISFGAGYNTTSTAISIQGDGFSDQYQVGLYLICKELTRLPQPGDNLELEGNSEVYRVATATILKGSEVPNLECKIQLSPSMTQELAPIHNTPLTIRSRFSQVRLTNHDFLNIGFGNELQSNYPNLPEETGLEPQDEVQETNNGRVFYSSTDQDGNFRVGDLFAVEQATGIVTLSADEFGLDGLSELSIGGVALGGSPVVITQFSTDGTFVANSNNIVPTQAAIKTYLTSRLSQGGSDTFTGLLTAGTVKVGGPDEITSTVAEGGEGWQVQIGTKANVTGPYAAWAGDGLAMAYFFKTLVDPTRNEAQ